MKNKVDSTKISSSELEKINLIIDHKSQFKLHFKYSMNLLVSFLKHYIGYIVKYRHKQFALKTAKLSVYIMCVAGPIIYFMSNPNMVYVQGKDSIKFIYENDSTRTQEYYLKKIAFYESGGSYNPKGNESYHGKYQLGRAALDAIGFNGISKEDFIADHELQEIAMRRLLKHNKKVLASLIGKYEGKSIGGIYITQSGILAASHLGGPGNVIKYLESNGTIIFKDGNGTPITKYLKELSCYQLNF